MLIRRKPLWQVCKRKPLLYRLYIQENETVPAQDNTQSHFTIEAYTPKLISYLPSIDNPHKAGMIRMAKVTRQGKG